MPDNQKTGFIAKVKNYLNTHETIFQLIKFAIFSFAAFVVEYVSFTVLMFALKNVNQDAIWWIFKYKSSDGGMGAMIAFFISTVLAQIASFVINRKKTFKATNNVVFSACAYAVMVAAIVVLNTWAGAAITTATNKIIDNLIICQYIGKLSGSFFSFVITFVMNKFVIMRSPKKKEEAPKEAI